MLVKFDQCQLGLRCCATGLLHMKRCYVFSEGDFKVFEQTLHAQPLACAGDWREQNHFPRGEVPVSYGTVQAVEEPFELDYGKRLVDEPYVLAGNEALALEYDLDAEVDMDGEPHDDDAAVGGQSFEFIHDDSGSDVEVPDPPRVSVATMQAVKRPHENTGHGSPKPLARAVMVSSAPAEEKRPRI